MDNDLLKKRIDEVRKEYVTETYPVSLGEVKNMYEEKDLIISPEFQRLYRWNNEQKSKLIESIFLGIPIPSIFVYQRDDGKWEVVDGLQRISTILQFFGVLRNYEPLILDETELIPEFKNKVWNKDLFSEEYSDRYEEISDDLKRYLKRAKLDFIIIKKESDPKAKYEVFIRINTLGSIATPQEIRNVIMSMHNESFFNKFKELAEYNPFKNSLNLSDEQLKKQDHLELLLKFFAILYYTDLLKNDIKTFLDKALFCILKINDTECKFKNFDIETAEKIFIAVFDLIYKSLGDKAFKRYDGENFKGKFLTSAFEAITYGVAINIELYKNIDNIEGKLKNKVIEMWGSEEFLNNIGSGTTAATRLPKLMSFAEKFYKLE